MRTFTSLCGPLQLARGASLTQREDLSVAPDTHVMQASVRPGQVSQGVMTHSEGRLEVRAVWRDLLTGDGDRPDRSAYALVAVESPDFPRVSGV